MLDSKKLADAIAAIRSSESGFSEAAILADLARKGTITVLPEDFTADAVISTAKDGTQYATAYFGELKLRCQVSQVRDGKITFRRIESSEYSFTDSTNRAVTGISRRIVG